MIKIALLEDYALFYSGIKPVLIQQKDFKVVCEARKIVKFISLIKELKPDLVIFDVVNCQNEGLAQIKRIKRVLKKAMILLVINKDLSDYFEDYIALGVNGLIFSNAGGKELLQAVETLKNGEDYFPPKVWLMLKDYLRKRKKDIKYIEEESTLTLREISILKHFCKGYSYKEIGARLNISPRTVESHKKNISTKLNIRSTAEMVEYAIQNNLS